MVKRTYFIKISSIAFLFLFTIDTSLAQIKGSNGSELSLDDLKAQLGTPFLNFQELHEYLTEKSHNNEFSGVVLIAENYNISFHKAYGYSSKRFDVKNKIDTKFNVGSIGKLFTSIAIMQLWKNNQLALDDCIGNYLEGFSEEIDKDVTIRQLLQHKSGWKHYWKNEYYLKNWYDLREVDDYMKFIKKIPLEFKPGSKREYSNIGYEVLGGIIEKVSGKEYHQYIKENILIPAKMFNTGAYDFNIPTKNLAIGYTNMTGYNDSGFVRNNIGLIPLKATPGGGLYSTAEDILKLYSALEKEIILPIEYTNVIMKGDFETSDANFETQGYAKTFTGGGPGINAMIFDSGSDIYIVLSNYDPPTASELHDDIVEMMAIKTFKNKNIQIKN